MRLNKFIALATGMSRRAADDAIANGRVTINNSPTKLGQQITPATDVIQLDGQTIDSPADYITIMLNKPVSYVCSRDGQGSRTIYELLPEQYHRLKPVGRLDKNSSGLLLLTNDGTLAYQLTHPSFQKEKTYQVTLSTELSKKDFDTITTSGVKLADGPSRLGLESIDSLATSWKVTMNEGRNRQIRRTFEELGYEVTKLHRTHFGDYRLDKLGQGNYTVLSD